MDLGCLGTALVEVLGGEMDFEVDGLDVTLEPEFTWVLESMLTTKSALYRHDNETETSCHIVIQKAKNVCTGEGQCITAILLSPLTISRSCHHFQSSGGVSPISHNALDQIIYIIFPPFCQVIHVLF